MRQRLLILIGALAILGATLPALASGGDSHFEFTGTIESLPSGGLVGDWTVAGKTVHVTSSTGIEVEGGMAIVGATVEVKGALRADGSIDATKIEVKSEGADHHEAAVHFTAVVESMPATGYVGTWVIGGRTVNVSASTLVKEEEGIPAVGSTVEVEGTEAANGSVDANKIEVHGGSHDGGSGGGEDFRVFGLVEALPSGSSLVGDWTVAGKTVHVTDSTRLEKEGGTFTVGAYVEVEGTAEADSSVTARKIELRKTVPPAGTAQASFHGPIEVLASAPGWIGDWQVGGRSVTVTGTTGIDQEHGTIALGALVEVHGTATPGGSLLADRIGVEWGPASSGSSLMNSWILPSSARKQGKGGAFYTTDVTISNLGSTEATVSLRFLGHNRDGRTGPERTFTLAAGSTISYADVLSSIFGIGDDYGAILISSNVATLAVESTTSTQGGGGEFGQGLRASSRNELVGAGAARSLVGVRDDSRFRTNLALTNASEKPIDVDLNLFGSSGGVLGSLRVHLEPLGMKQIDEVSRALGVTSDVNGARLVVSTPTRAGAFAAYASVINNGTGDSRILSPR